MPTRGYNSYHGRRSLWKILLALLLLLLLAAAGAFLLLQDYIVYESDGSIRLELPVHPPDQKPPEPGAGTGDSPGADSGGQEEEELPPVVILPRDEPEPEPPEPLRASLLTAAALCGEGDPLGDILAAGGTGFVVELKGDDGVFYYDSALAQKGAAPSAVAAEQLKAVLAGAEELTAVAQLSCFHDSAFAFSDMAGAGVCQKSGYIWYDYQNSHWLDPAKTGTKDYLFAVAQECAEMGFDELLLTQFHYPLRGKLYKIDYSQMTVAKEEALCAFLTELRATLGEEIALSIEIDADILIAGTSADGGIDVKRLLPLVDHICVAAGEREAEVLEALRAAGAEEPESVALFRRGDALVSAAAEAG